MLRSFSRFGSRVFSLPFSRGRVSFTRPLRRRRQLILNDCYCFFNRQVSTVGGTAFPPLQGTVQSVTFDEDVFDAKLAMRIIVWFVLVTPNSGISPMHPS